eukprot:TRINITY_DN3287_c0_g3_i5.p1 TRINITY_DN3287_c0_g3~~TRINITY_DN3287_c0_g3_i5.p1  ORF type:complete len:587 (+),score=116.04 TRINITY_DN3287_c0_g3_i5:139-1899(+)
MEESIDSAHDDLSSPKQTRRRKATAIANVLNTEYDIVKEILEDTMGCRLSYESEDETSLKTKEWDLYWNDLTVTPELLTKLRPYQKVNHFPGMEALYRKNLLARNLNRMRRMYPEEYDFFPSSWVLPVEWGEFRRQFNGKNKTFIVKPEAGSQGKGIFLTRHWANIDPEEHYVVQRYLGNPYLIDDLKFDLRIYVLVYGCDPYRIFIHKEGLARFATEEYTHPKPHNLKNTYIHLTNYALNKDNDNFEFNTEADRADTGHKRSLDFVWRHIREHGGDPTKVQRDIKRCIVKSFCAVQPHLAHMYRSCQPNDFDNNKCFEILGFDVLLDHKLKPWLLEVNHAPSFSTDTPFDYKVKAKLLEDTFRLLNLDASKRLKYYKDKNAFVVVKGSRMPREEREKKKERRMKKRDEYEVKNLGEYERIYPECGEECEKLIKAAAEVERAINKKGFLPSIRSKETEHIKRRINSFCKPSLPIQRKNHSKATACISKQRTTAELSSASALETSKNRSITSEYSQDRRNVREFMLPNRRTIVSQKQPNVALIISKLRTPVKNAKGAGSRCASRSARWQSAGTDCSCLARATLTEYT